MNEKEFNKAYELLTPTQKEYLQLFLAGEDDKTIAIKKDCTKDNVRQHISQVCRNFGFKNLPGEHFRQRQELVELFAKHKSEWVNHEALKKYHLQTLSVPELEFPDGSVALGSPFYVERLPIESDCYEEILKPGALIRIKAPKQMGKTSLLERILDVAAKQGDRTVSLNLLLADQAVLSNLEKFLRWLCASVGGQLGLTNQLAEYWDEDLSSNSNCTNYFAEYLLAEIDTPVTLGLDEVDRVFPYSEIAPAFFGLLRTGRNYGQSHEIWKRLRLVLAHSTEVYLQLDINRSPFNVGLPIKLLEFSQKQVQDLAKRHGLDWASGKEAEQLMAMVGGHPNLVRLALYHLGRQEVTLEQLLQEAPTESGIYSDHLRGHLGNLEEHPKLADAMRQVVSATEPERLEAKLAFKLDSMGLVKRQGNEVTPSCKLYRQYFRDRLEVKG